MEYGLVKHMSTAPSAQRVFLGSRIVLVGSSPHNNGSSSLQLALRLAEDITQTNDSTLQRQFDISKDIPVITPLSLLLSKILRNSSIPSTCTFRCSFINPLLASPIAAITPLFAPLHNNDPPPGTLLLTFGTTTLTASDGTIKLPLALRSRHSTIVIESQKKKLRARTIAQIPNPTRRSFGQKLQLNRILHLTALG